MARYASRFTASQAGSTFQCSLDGAAYSVETSYQYYKHQRLQAAADAAAYAGALELLNGSSYATIKSVATAV